MCSHCPTVSSMRVTSQERKEVNLPSWAVAASRVALTAAGIFLAPESFFLAFAFGAGVGYMWPEADQLDMSMISIGCNQNFWDVVAKRKQPMLVAMLISTLVTLHHMEHAVALYVPLAGYMVGQWAGGELYGQVRR